MGKQFKTPLYEEHLKNKGKIIDFHNWLLPLEYSGILKETKSVRTTCGLFDISHMGEFIVKGEKRLEFLQRITFNDVSLIKEGKAQYNLLTNHKGGISDDLLIYNLGDHYMCVVNAANIEKDLFWMKENIIEDVMIDNISYDTGLISLQGPLSSELIQDVFKKDFSSLRYMQITKINEFLISRTGYTGEDGFEIISSAKNIIDIWNKFIGFGEKYKLQLCGLGARDILRIEAGYPLYGNELNDDIDPYQASLAWTTKLEKDFIGKKALLERIEKINIKRIGFIMKERGFARNGNNIFSGEGELIGKVTSGTFSPNLNQFIGMGYVDINYSNEDREIMIEIRNKLYPATIKKFPFIKIRTYKNAPIAQ